MPPAPVKKERVISLLREVGPLSASALAVSAQVGRAYASQVIAGLADHTHIYGWERSQGSGPFVPVYAWGHGVTPKQPDPLSRKTICEKYRNLRPDKVRSTLKQHRLKKRAFANVYNQLIQK